MSGGQLPVPGRRGGEFVYRKPLQGIYSFVVNASMDVGADSAATAVTAPGLPQPPNPAVQLPETAGGGPVGGGDGVSKSGGDAVVLDLGKMLPVPEEGGNEGDLDAAAARGQGECVSVVVDLRCENAKGVDDGGSVERSWDAEKECRICHVSPDRRDGAEVSELIQLGCGCKNELGIAHRHCAEAWFKLKGNRCCEICGVTAKNITGIEDVNFLEEWNQRTLSISGNGNTADRGRCWRGQPLCNFLMACLVIAFILPWFFRVNMF